MAKPNTYRLQRGVSLVELMIAVALASFLLIGLIQIFGASRQAYQTSVGISRIQEAARFGSEFLQRDLRMAGHLGWAGDMARMFSATFPSPSGSVDVRQVDNLLAADADANRFNSALELSTAPFPFRFDMAVQGFEAAATAPGQTIVLEGRDVAAADHWTPALDAGLYAGMSPRPLAGSDVVVLRFLGQDGVPVRFDKDTSQITYLSAGDAGFMREGRFYGIANYGAVALFQAPAAPTGTTITIAANGANARLFEAASEPLRGNVVLYPAHIFAYYVGLGASGAPSLFRASFSGAAWSSEELVEGVEVLQLTYGRDTLRDVTVPQPAPPAVPAPAPCPAVGGQCVPDGSVDSYVAADTLVAGLTTEWERAARWRAVGAVRVGMLVRSPERAGTPPRNEAAVGNLFIGRSVIDLPEGPEGSILRRPYESTVALRNRLYGN